MGTNLHVFTGANNGRTINLLTNFSKNTKNNSLKLSSGFERATQSAQLLLDEPVFTPSDAAKKLLEDKEKERQEKYQKMLDELRAKSSSLKEAEKTSKKNRLSEKIAEIKGKLKQLVERMRSALLFGDKRTAALLAKEAAQLAKELASAIKSAGGSNSGGDVSVPTLNLSGESAGATEAGEGAENINVENVNAEAMNVENMESEAVNAEPPTDVDTSQADASQAEEAQNEVGKPELQQALSEAKKGIDEAMTKLKGMTSKKTDGVELSDDDKRNLAEIVALLKTIMSMAKATLRQKTNVGNDASENPQAESRLEKEVSDAEKEIEDAIAVIADAISSIPAA